MTDEQNVIPPQPRRRRLMRRVKAHRLAGAAALSALLASASALFDLDAVLVHHAGPVFWLSALLLGTTLVCALIALLLSFAEQPKEVEILEGSTSHVIHLER